MATNPNIGNNNTKKKSFLTKQQTECLHWAGIGKTSWEIKEILGISVSTVNYHITLACQRLNVHSRQAALCKALIAGYLPIDGNSLTDNSNFTKETIEPSEHPTTPSAA